MYFFRKLLFIVIVTLLITTPAPGEDEITSTSNDNQIDWFLSGVRDQLRARIDQRFGGEGFVCRGEPVCAVQSLPVFYESRDYAPAWFNAEGLRPAVFAMARSIRQVPGEGLWAADYHLKIIEQLLQEIEAVPFPPSLNNAGLWADLDLILSDSFLLLSSHLTVGRVNPETLHPDWISTPPGVDILALLNAAAADEPIDAIFEELKPQHTGYAELRLALEQMRQTASEGGWPRIDEGPKLNPLEHDARIPILRLRLQLSGDLAQASDVDKAYDSLDPCYGDDHFDEGLVQALQHFQARHGLEPDGILGRQTLEALNVTAAQRVRQIELNLERWRWLPLDLGQHYIVVNTADFRLEIVNGGLPALTMRVVVGRPARRTPVFSALMTYMVVNPYWTIPHTIAVEDILPRLKAGENYLQEHNIHLFDGWNGDAMELDPQTIDWAPYSKRRFPFQLRQDPGSQNALGSFKFMFPNKFAVYLHDTPQRDHFKKVKRDFSSGCIRVENALSLASYLLKDNPGWTEARLKSLVRQNNGERVIFFRDPLPVHLIYQTSWVDRSRVLHFRNDIYGRDKALDSALRHPSANAPTPIEDDRTMALK